MTLAFSNLVYLRHLHPLGTLGMLCVYTLYVQVTDTMYAVNAPSKGSVGDVRHGACMQFRNPSQVYDN